VTKFNLKSNYQPTGDQPAAIKQLIKGLDSGEKEQTLLGVTGSGKSVVGDTFVTILQNGIISQLPIMSIIDNLFMKYSSYIQFSNDSEYIEISNVLASDRFKTWSFNPKTGVNSWNNVTQISRHNAKKTMRISTKCGRSVTTTIDHNFYIIRDGKMQLVRSDDIIEDDMLPAPRYISGPINSIDSIFVLDSLDTKGLYVSLSQDVLMADLNPFTEILYRKRWAIVNKAERLSASDYIVSGMSSVAKLSAIRIGANKLASQIPINIKLSNNLLRFFGYYIAEGHAEERYITITSADKEIISDIYMAMDDLGLSTLKRQQNYDYQINSVVFTRLISTFCGHGAWNKKLPTFWTQLNNEQLGQMLKAYFSGDGGIDGGIVSATTASRQLASDLQYALLRFGIQARRRNKKIIKPDGSTCLFSVIAISGKSNLMKFSSKINFSLQRKQKSLHNLLKRDVQENTNVDIIPVSANNILTIRNGLGWSQQALAEVAGVNRSYISMLEAGLRSPSFSFISRFVKTLEKQEVRKPEVESCLSRMRSLIYNFWTPVKAINIVNEERVVYDFAVEEGETFLAGDGGLFVHNTFTMANIIADRQVPTLVLAHNKTLAAQLYSEFKSFFPDNEVHYFVSYFDYYQPEAYMASSDTYIEKDSKINDEIDRLRHAATVALLTHRDTIIVASVSCIYGIGSPEAYSAMSIIVKKGEKRQQDKFVRLLTDIQYHRNDIDFHRGTFRVRGDIVDVFPAGSNAAYRIEFFGDLVERLTRIDPLTGEILAEPNEVSIFPSSHYVTPKDKLKNAVLDIKKEYVERMKYFKKHDKLLEAQRLSQRIKYDIEMLEETGFVKGIENYSRYLTNREPGEQPATLMDYFSDDFLLLVDESHMTLPQVRGMYNGDRARKEVLVEYGFRMPSALDNRPLTFAEFNRHINQAIYVSATPSEYELTHSPAPAQQVIRPTGLLDPEIIIRPTKGQIDDLIAEIRDRIAKKQRVLVTTLTKRMAEDLSSYLQEVGIKTAYIHSEVDTLERGDILRDLRTGVYDVLVGINLLREGLDLPEVSMVAIMDADKEGFLRSAGALIQTSGRAARHLEGKVYMYADRITDSMKYAINETKRRRDIQEAYNKKHNITPESIAKEIDEGLRALIPKKEVSNKLNLKKIPKDEYPGLIKELAGQMDFASANLEFEKAAELRDQIADIKAKL